VIYADTFAGFRVVDWFLGCVENAVLERLFGRTREDFQRRADEKYARQNFMIGILPQIFFRKIK